MPDYRLIKLMSKSIYTDGYWCKCYDCPTPIPDGIERWCFGGNDYKVECLIIDDEDLMEWFEKNPNSLACVELTPNTFPNFTFEAEWLPKNVFRKKIILGFNKK